MAVCCTYYRPTDFSKLPNRNHTKNLSLNEKFRETFKKRYIVETINKAEIRPAEKSEKAESCSENLWKKIQLKGP